MVENIVAIELAYINTKHPDFQREAAMVGSLMAPDSLKHSSSRSEKPAKNRPVQLATNALPAITNGEPEKENLMPKVISLLYFDNFRTFCFRSFRAYCLTDFNSAFVHILVGGDFFLNY